MIQGIEIDLGLNSADRAALDATSRGRGDNRKLSASPLRNPTQVDQAERELALPSVYTKLIRRVGGNVLDGITALNNLPPRSNEWTQSSQTLARDLLQMITFLREYAQEQTSKPGSQIHINQVIELLNKDHLPQLPFSTQLAECQNFLIPFLEDVETQLSTSQQVYQTLALCNQTARHLGIQPEVPGLQEEPAFTAAVSLTSFYSSPDASRLFWEVTVTSEVQSFVRGQVQQNGTKGGSSYYYHQAGTQPTRLLLSAETSKIDQEYPVTLHLHFEDRNNKDVKVTKVLVIR